MYRFATHHCRCREPYRVLGEPAPTRVLGIDETRRSKPRCTSQVDRGHWIPLLQRRRGRATSGRAGPARAAAPAAAVKRWWTGCALSGTRVQRLRTKRLPDALWEIKW